MTDRPDENTIRRRRPTAVAAESETEPVDDATQIARPGFRRRAARDIGGAPRARPAPPMPAPSGRAVAPDAGAHAVYGVRPADPVVVDRTAPPARAPQAPIDGAAAAAAQLRRARRTALALGLAASAGLAGAAVSLLVVLFSP